jgi:circadian clock protein KaiB
VKAPIQKKAPAKPKASKAKPPTATPVEWDLRLYVAGTTFKSASALRNLTHLCDVHLAGRYHIEVIDLVKDPQLARGDQILAVPTVVRKLPAPICKIIGDMSDAQRVLVGLDLRRHHAGSPVEATTKKTHA